MEDDDEYEEYDDSRFIIMDRIANKSHKKEIIKMVTLNIYKDNVKDKKGNLYPIYNINIYDKINLVLGDSGTGKTYLFNGLVSAISNRNPWTYECFNHLNKNNKR